jgi:DnaJ-class molecular chaperone
MAKVEYVPCTYCSGSGYVIGMACSHCTAGLKTVVRKDENGKVLKPKGWTPPDISAIIRRQLRLP